MQLWSSSDFDLNDEIDISRGNVLVKAGEQPLISRSARASVVWMTDQPLVLVNFIM
jgi:sulfate adenylyltransferase subunit 1